MRERRRRVFSTACLAEEGHDGETDEQIVNGMGDHSREEAAGLLIDPGPQHGTPTDTDETSHTVAVSDPENTGAYECCRQETELAAQNGEQKSAKRQLFKDRSEHDVFNEAYSSLRRRSPDQVGIEPFGPMTRPVKVFREMVDRPFPPQAC